MQIPTGENFGNRLPQLRQSNIQGPSINAEASMGQSLAALGAAFVKIEQDNEAMAKLALDNKLLDRQQQMDERYENWEQQVLLGEVSENDLNKHYEQTATDLAIPDISKLNNKNQEIVKHEWKQSDYFFEKKVKGLKGTLRKLNGGKELDKSIQLKINEAMKPGANLEIIKQQLDTDEFNRTGLLAHGEKWQEVKNNKLRQLDFSYLQGQIDNATANKDSQTLKQIQKNLLDSEQYSFMNNLDRNQTLQQVNPLVDRTVGIFYGKSLSEGIAKPIEKTGNFEASNTYSAMQIEYSKLYSSENTDKSKTSENSTIGFAPITAEMAKEAAEKSGEPFDEQKFNTDTQYHLQLSQATYQYYLEEYGSPMMAVAAYTVGKEEMNKWLKSAGDPRKNEITEEDFIEKIPDQNAKKQLTNVADHVAKAGQYTLALAKKFALMNIDNNPNLNDKQKSIAKRETTLNCQVLEEQQKNDDIANYTRQWCETRINKVPFNELSPESVSKLRPKQRRILEKDPTKDFDYELFRSARGYLKARDWVSAINEFGGDFPVENVVELVNLQEKIKGNPALGILIKDSVRVADSQCDEARIYDYKERHKIYDIVTEAVMWRQEQNKPMSPTEIEDFAKKQVISLKMKNTGWIVNTTKYHYQATNAERINSYIKDADVIPSDIRDIIIKSRKKEGLPITNEVLVEEYNQGLSDGKY